MSAFAARVKSKSARIGFHPTELEVVEQLLTAYFADDSAQQFWLTDQGDIDQIIGMAYCELERMTDQTWNLQLIAIHPSHQGQGHGSKLLGQVEAQLQAQGGRMLLVETLASFDQAQAFYKKHGYAEEARIRDFYAQGDDKIVFRKVLTVL